VKDTPERITDRFIIQNAEYTIGSDSREWQAWIWKQFVLFRFYGRWEPGNYNQNLSDFWDIFSERKKTWPAVYFIIDANDLDIQTEEFRRYLKENWMHLLDREDLSICMVAEKEMKRQIWTSIMKLLGKQDRMPIFKDLSEAFVWIRGKGIKNGA
jgi:hypothetical protein